MSGNEYKAEILWHEAPDEGDITWSLTGECRVRVVRIDDYDEPTMVEFYVPVNGDPAGLEDCTPAHLRAIAIRAGRPLATPRTAVARRAAIEVILSAETEAS